MFPFAGSSDESGLSTVDMTTPPLCSHTRRLCLTFHYVVSRGSSELRVLARCGGRDWGQQTAFSQTSSSWLKANLTLAACPEGDTQVGV